MLNGEKLKILCKFVCCKIIEFQFFCFCFSGEYFLLNNLLYY